MTGLIVSTGIVVAALVILRACQFVGGLCAAASKRPPLRPLYQHVCGSCGRIQMSLEEIDRALPCRACQFDSLTHVEIDLDDFADADAIRLHLNGVEVRHLNSQPRENCLSTPAAHPDAA